MNIIQKAIAKLTLKVLGNAYLNSVLSYTGMSMPAWLVDNLEVYVTRGYASNADVYSIVNLIMTKAAAVPWILQEEGADGKWNDIDKHELLELINNPNPFQTRTDYVKAYCGFYYTTGNVYQYAYKLSELSANVGKPEGGMYILPSQQINIKLSDNKESPIQGYFFLNKPSDIIPEEQVCHTKTWNPNDPFYGMSPFKPGSKNIVLSDIATEANVRSYHNLGPGGILARESGAESEFTIEQGNNLKLDYKREHTGVRNIKNTLMTGATVKWIQMGMSPVDLNIIAQEKMNQAKLCNLVGLPVQLLNNTDASTYNNMNEAHKAAYEQCFLPVLYQLAEDWNSWLVPAYERNRRKLRLIPDTSGIAVLQEDKKEKVEWLKNAFWITLDKKQEMMGLEVDEKVKGVYCDPNGNPINFEGDMVDQAERAIEELNKAGIKGY